MCVYAKLNQILAVGLKSCILLKQNLSSSISYIFLKFVNVNQSQTDTILVFLFSLNLSAILGILRITGGIWFIQDLWYLE